MDTIRNIVLIGAGNVSTQLGLALTESGYKVLQVYSRTIESASILAQKLNCEFTNDLGSINPGADLYIVSVSDAAIPQIISKLSLQNSLVVHTSGSLGMNELKGVSENYGVFYPLQTFSKNRKVDFKNIPICLEANNEENLSLLHMVAQKLSHKIEVIGSEQRSILHLAAVFACNFPNFMFTIAEEITKKNGLNFDLLKPLIEETTAKIANHDPSKVQTGPAKRNDKAVLEKHMNMLNAFPQYQKLYRMISDAISRSQNNQ